MITKIIPVNIVVSIMSFALISGCADSDQNTSPSAKLQDRAVLFDDFTYTKRSEMESNGWIVRNGSGWPGVIGATWWDEGVSLHTEGGNGIVRLSSQTDGSAENTRQSQFCHARKYFEGTYAARVKFSNEPKFGPDGDEVIQTFYAIAPQIKPLHPDYSEVDFEYLPNGGWGTNTHTIFSTSWVTFQLEPWTPINKHDKEGWDLEGWHTLVIQVTGGVVRYFVDGKPLGEHDGRAYPVVPMSVNFNQWFTAEGAIKSSELRGYEEHVDWVFHAVDATLSPEEVENEVKYLRSKAVSFIDTVPEQTPLLPSPCDF